MNYLLTSIGCRLAEAYMLISIPTATSTIVGVFHFISKSPGEGIYLAFEGQHPAATLQACRMQVDLVCRVLRT